MNQRTEYQLPAITAKTTFLQFVHWCNNCNNPFRGCSCCTYNCESLKPDRFHEPEGSFRISSCNKKGAHNYVALGSHSHQRETNGEIFIPCLPYGAMPGEVVFYCVKHATSALSHLLISAYQTDILVYILLLKKDEQEKRL